MNEWSTEAQQQIADRLLTEGWQARQIASPNHPGSKWVLSGPRRRARLIMSTGRFDSTVRLSIAAPSFGPGAPPTWQMVAWIAPVEVVVAAALAAERATDGEPIAWSRRRLDGRLRGLGWRASVRRLLLDLVSTVAWGAPDGRHWLTLSAARAQRSAEARLCGEGLRISLSPYTPVAVVAEAVRVVGAPIQVGGDRDDCSA